MLKGYVDKTAFLPSFLLLCFLQQDISTLSLLFPSKAKNKMNFSHISLFINSLTAVYLPVHTGLEPTPVDKYAQIWHLSCTNAYM